MPSLIDKWLHGDKAIAAMGTIILAMLMSITPHFFLDMLLLATYHDAQESFQRLYLCIHFVCSLLSFVIIAYSFWAINAQTYHAFCNMRSWSLLIGLFMFFSGFFSILGFALDWHKFRDHCASDISYSTVGQESHRCREIWAALTTSISVLWAITETCYGLLVVFIGRYKRIHFAEQELEKEEKEKVQLLERYQALGMKEGEAMHKVDQVYAPYDHTLEYEQEEVFAEMGRMLRTAQHVRQSDSTAGKAKRSATMPFLPQRAMSFFMPKLGEESEQPAGTANRARVITESKRDNILVTNNESNTNALCDSPEILIDPPTPRGWRRDQIDPDEIQVIRQTPPTTANELAESPSRLELNPLVRPSRANAPARNLVTPHDGTQTLRPPEARRKRPKRSMTTR